LRYGTKLNDIVGLSVMFVPLVAAIFVGAGLAVFFLFASNGFRRRDREVFARCNVGCNYVVIIIAVGESVSFDHSSLYPQVTRFWERQVRPRPLA